jgi:cation:H+ antiporter
MLDPAYRRQDALALVTVPDALWSVLMIGLIPGGLIILNQGAKLITDNAVIIARISRRSRFVVGTLLVSTLAALPEVLVSVFALTEGGPGGPEIAMSNVLASNITTIAFVIGLSAIIAPISASREVVLRDAIFLMTITIVASALLMDHELSFFDGVALMALFVPYTINLLLVPRTVKEEELEAVVEEHKVEMEYMGHLIGKPQIRKGVRWLFFGVVWAIIGAQLVVRSSIQLSGLYHLNPWILGITVVAVGTSLPDIAASFHASRNGFSDLALGEGIGANIFTTLLTLGIMGVSRPLSYSLALILPMILSMNFVTVLLLFLMVRKWRIGRTEGAVLLACYFGAVAINLLFLPP